MRASRLRWTIVLALLVCARMSGAADDRIQSALTGVETEEERRARLRVERMERTLDELHTLPMAEQIRRRADLERDLERLAEQVSGTKHENKAVYWLAEWRLVHRHGEEVQPLLERLAGLRYPAYKTLGQVLRVRLMLTRGDTREARRLAERVVGRVPEFAPVLDLVSFHEQVGELAPRLPGRDLRGGAGDDPLRERAEPWLLVAFAELSDPEQRYLVGRYAVELAREEYRGRVGFICVGLGGDPLGTMTRFAELGADDHAGLLWSNPNDDDASGAWRSAWRFPEPPAVVLLGPDRRIMAIDPPIARLRPLGGLEPDDDPGRSTRTLWRGRYGSR